MGVAVVVGRRGRVGRKDSVRRLELLGQSISRGSSGPAHTQKPCWGRTRGKRNFAGAKIATGYVLYQSGVILALDSPGRIVIGSRCLKLCLDVSGWRNCVG